MTLFVSLEFFLGVTISSICSFEVAACGVVARGDGGNRRRHSFYKACASDAIKVDSGFTVIMGWAKTFEFGQDE